MSVRRSLALSFAQRYVATIITFIATLILARLLSPAQIGIFSLCAAFVAIASVVRDFGVSEYLIQERNLDTQKIRGAFAVAIVVSWSMAIFIFLARGFLADFYRESGVSEVLTVLSINFLLLPLASPAFALLTRELAFGPIFVIQTVSALAGSTVSVVLAVWEFGYMSLAWGSLAGVATQIVAVSIARPKESWLLPALRPSGRAWKYGIGLSVTHLIDAFAKNANDFIIPRQLGFDALGLFSKAVGLLDQFQTNVTSAIARVAMPTFAASLRSAKDIQGSYYQTISLYTGLAWPFYAVVAVAAPDIIRVLLGPQWTGASDVARILCAAYAIDSLWAFAPTVLAASGQVRRRLHIALIGTPFCLATLLIASFFDLRAIAFASVVNSCLLLFLWNRQLRNVERVTLVKVLVASRGSGVLAAATAVGALAGWFIDGTSLARTSLRLLITLLMALAVWVATAKLIKHPILAELLTVVASAARIVKLRY